MLTQLREIVEKVATAPSLLDALEQLVISTCKAMKTECCSVYIADQQRQRFTLMATKGLKKPHRHVGLPFGQGLVGLVADRAEPINVADARHHPHFKHLPGSGKSHSVPFSVHPSFTSVRC